MDYIISILPAMMRGTMWAIGLFVITLVLSLPLGLPLALGENSRIKPVKWFCNLYVLVFRGTPLLLQLFFFYFVIPMALGVRFSQDRDVDAFVTACVTFVLNYAAYFAEIYRGGMNGIDRGQYEAAASLGLSKVQTIFGIVVPQMLRMVLPPVSNEAIVLIKDTSLAYVIAVPELMKAANSAVNRDVTVVPYILAAVIYLLFTFVVTIIFNKIEKRASRFDQKEEW
ncbi:MAG: amino acid ABC transporter permease [Firmicutes bacterium]|nr:amino acid ABC transporter permease [Bacillota bacterium]